MYSHDADALTREVQRALIAREGVALGVAAGARGREQLDAGAAEEVCRRGEEGGFDIVAGAGVRELIGELRPDCGPRSRSQRGDGLVHAARERAEGGGRKGRRRGALGRPIATGEQRLSTERGGHGASEGDCISIGPINGRKAHKVARLMDGGSGAVFAAIGRTLGRELRQVRGGARCLVTHVDGRVESGLVRNGEE